jgi:hypothetical protein
MSKTTIRLITNREDLEEVYRFRYTVYVQAMGRESRYAEHEARQLRHPLDATGINIAALDGPSIIGVIRNNFGVDGSFGQFWDFYGIGHCDYEHPRQTSITSGLMVATTRRGGFLGARLAIAAYEDGLSRGIRWNFIDCIPSLAPFYLAFGWVEHLPEATHPEYFNRVRRLRLDLEDEKHFERVRSPFLDCYRKHRARRSRGLVPLVEPSPDLQKTMTLRAGQEKAAKTAKSDVISSVVSIAPESRYQDSGQDCYNVG